MPKNLVRYALGGVMGALLLWALQTPEPFNPREMIVAAPRIIEREALGEPGIVEKLRYVYVQPDVRAVAPGSVTGDVAAFCKPVVVVKEVREPAPALIRYLSITPAVMPLARDRLFVTSMNGYGDLYAEDFAVRPGFSVAAGLQEPYATQVRYPRFPVREVAEGVLWYAALRAVEGVLR